MNITDALFQEIQKRNMFFLNKHDFYEKMNKFLENYDYISILKKEYGGINEGFLSLVDAMSLEQLIVLKFVLSSRKTQGEILPFWFFKNLDKILKFIIVKYCFSLMNNLNLISKYLDVPIEELEEILFIKEE